MDGRRLDFQSVTAVLPRLNEIHCWKHDPQIDFTLPGQQQIHCGNLVFSQQQMHSNYFTGGCFLVEVELNFKKCTDCREEEHSRHDSVRNGVCLPFSLALALDFLLLSAQAKLSPKYASQEATSGRDTSHQFKNHSAQGNIRDSVEHTKAFEAVLGRVRLSMTRKDEPKRLFMPTVLDGIDFR
ncbi:uncharacterized protein LY89DRAFT_676837 [Mollisia scopiformis]|uniref:Uncharacterized protein n=1 Tax=Mollisia scopiformis TaxID=149040 RepID=A0A132B9S0_MOLSC|nr:uncharacterized protein LY89DRAFT_676837 [Mollisia scopiformis]KUJ08417.1 hypothetical protein LY89DRAFT_676837 [Mollisia scopiformis]